MKKQIIVLGIMCMITCAYLTGCGKKTNENTSADVASGQNEELANPMIQYATYPELEAATDIKYLFMPEATGYTCDTIYLIDHEIVELNYVSKDDENKKMCVRTAKGEEDISGVYDIIYEEKEINGKKVNMGLGDNGLQVSWWTDGTYSYSIMIENAEDSDIDNMVSYAIDL